MLKSISRTFIYNNNKIQIKMMSVQVEEPCLSLMRFQIKILVKYKEMELLLSFNCLFGLKTLYLINLKIVNLQIIRHL